MQSALHAHQVAGAPHVLVDGFRLRVAPSVPEHERVYILTHYHSDHYTGLSDRWSHGPINCTSITAKFVSEVLKVLPSLVHPMPLDTPFPLPRGVTATFLDSNHCPGAAMVLFSLPSTSTSTGSGAEGEGEGEGRKGEEMGLVHHLHCGDMRFHPRFKDYKALQGLKITHLYLDTTYAHPKHTFCDQSLSIETIASEAKEFLQTYPKGVVLLSAYNIGKERVIDAVAVAVGGGSSSGSGSGSSSSSGQEEVDRCCVQMSAEKLALMELTVAAHEFAARKEAGCYTTDPRAARVHVIGMGVAASMWPYFVPNWKELLALKHGLGPEFCSHLLAVVPTGWAASGNYNKRNATSVCPSDEAVTIRLVPYSEHSSYTELVEFVTFLKPLKVIPTVYKDEADLRRIEGLFDKLTDKSAGKRLFLSKLVTPSSSAGADKEKEKETLPPAPAAAKRSRLAATANEGKDDEDEVIIVETKTTAKAKGGVGGRGGEQWACQRCTLLNAPAASECAACGGPSSSSLGPGAKQLSVKAALQQTGLRSFFSSRK